MSDLLDFLIEKPCHSYEYFQQQIRQNFKDDKHFLNFFRRLEQRAAAPGHGYKEIKDWVESIRYSYFSTNCLYFYRWLISEGCEKFADSEINLFYDFLNEIGVTDLAVKQVKWGITFMVRETLEKNVEHCWEDNICKHFSLEAKNLFTFSEMIDYFLVYHVGLKQLFSDEKIPQSETQEVVLTNYMNLVNRFPELEEIFGTAIEKDIFRVYKILERGKNE